MMSVQVRSAYRKKGWAFTDPQGIEQCAKEGFSKALQEQAGEGCHMWGTLNINKVSKCVNDRFSVVPVSYMCLSAYLFAFVFVCRRSYCCVFLYKASLCCVTASLILTCRPNSA